MTNHVTCFCQLPDPNQRPITRVDVAEQLLRINLGPTGDVLADLLTTAAAMLDPSRVTGHEAIEALKTAVEQATNVILGD